MNKQGPKTAQKIASVASSSSSASQVVNSTDEASAVVNSTGAASAAGGGGIGDLLSAASSLKQTKKCTLCENFKIYNDFSRCGKNKSKRKAACRDCRNKQNKAYLATKRAKEQQIKRKRKATIELAKRNGKIAKPKPGDKTLDKDIASFANMPVDAINDYAQIKVKKKALKEAQRKLKILHKAINKQNALLAGLVAALE